MVLGKRTFPLAGDPTHDLCVCVKPLMCTHGLTNLDWASIDSCILDVEGWAVCFSVHVPMGTLF